MRRGVVVGCLLAGFSLVQAITGVALLHPDVVDAYNRSGEAAQAADYQQALVLLEGSLYPEGVRLAVENDDPARRAIVTAAVDTWSRQLQGDNPVRVVSSRDPHDILVRWVPTIPETAGSHRCALASDHSLGLIRLQKRYRWNRTARELTITGTIFVAEDPESGPLSREEQRDVVLHELGHLLGLDDRPDVGPLMGPLERGRPSGQAARDEVESVRTLRRMLRDRISLIQNHAVRASRQP